MVKKYNNRIKSQQHVHIYKVQLISVTYGSVRLYSVAFEFAPTICCTDDRKCGGSVVTCSYSMLKVEGSNHRGCAFFLSLQVL